MKAKKFLSMILIGVTAVSLLAGCGNSNTAESQTDTADDASQAEEETTSEPAETQDIAEATEDAQSSDTDAADTASGEGNVLVVYYSATGNTEEVANYIADAAGGDLFQVEPAEPYTDDDLNWTDENSRVSQEHEDESLRDVELVSTEVENWDSYDTVFIGYPIWWGIAAWPVDTFVEANDFTGKTVIPFATSSSSGMGESGQLLADLAGTGEWQEGMRFQSGADEADVQEWVEGLGL
ncbi:MAG: flavodoxin [Ruminococcus sp.]|jgi:flavodoxin